jgi:hypothetical protein
MEISEDGKSKQCEQCKETKSIDRFRKVVNMYTSVHYMSICKDCYNRDLEDDRRQREEQWRQWQAEHADERASRRRFQEQWEEEREERERQLEQEQLARQHVLDGWYQQQPDRQCIGCKQMLPASAFGYASMSEVDGIWLPSFLHQRCKRCHEQYYKKAEVPCCVCQQKKGNLLGHYQGYALYGGGTAIRLYCHKCEKEFLGLPIGQQAFYIRSRCNLAFPSGQISYGLTDETDTIYYIGRTSDQKRRFQDHLKDVADVAVTRTIVKPPGYTILL